MSEGLIGAWHTGDIRSGGLYDAATGAFAANPAEG
jgi:hypothetical protein